MRRHRPHYTPHPLVDRTKTEISHQLAEIWSTYDSTPVAVCVLMSLALLLHPKLQGIVEKLSAFEETAL